ncbi:MAG TPA: hypothetical protein VJM50_24685, partial [Pyrinomonadaceae bacterium]|nr:hypothetical protein [Pyrinomonadaceae bacterium]
MTLKINIDELYSWPAHRAAIYLYALQRTSVRAYLDGESSLEALVNEGTAIEHAFAARFPAS